MMAAKLSSVFVVVCVVASALAAPKIADYATLCSLKDPKLNDCMLEKTKEIFPKLIAGVKEWNLPALDPLFIEKFELQKPSGNAAVSLEISGYDLTFHGLKDTVFESVKADPEMLHFEFRITIPVFDTEGRYKTKGKILLLPISGEGAGTFGHDDEKVNLGLNFKKVEKEGKMYMHLDKIVYEILGLKNTRFHLDNLFNNKQLSDNMNAVMTKNSKAVFEELKPRLQTSFAHMMLLVLKPMFETVPMEEFFTDV